MAIETNKKAIIDIGSNSIRLVVYSYNSIQGLIEHHNFKTVARLSMYIQKTGKLSGEGVNILLKTLINFKGILADIHIQDVFVAATAAIRQATNQLEILKIVESKVGFKLQILTEDQEAYFGYFAVIHSMNIPSAVTIDMGGGSTEITYFIDKKLVYCHSFSFGAVSLKRRFIKGTVCTEEEKEALTKYVTQQFQSLEWLNDLQVPIIAIGGSARNIAQVDLQRKTYPLNGIHQYELKEIDLEEISSHFAQCTLDELKKIDGLSSDRSDIIVPALETFRVFMKTVGTSLFIYSKKGLREGIIFSQIAEKFPDDFLETDVSKNAVRHILGRFQVSEEEATHLYGIFHHIYTKFIDWNYIEAFPDEGLLKYAFQLFHIGRNIDFDAASQHSFYVITNLTIDGVSNTDRLKIALLASYQNRETYKSFVKSLPSFLTEKEYKQLRDIGALFRFIQGLDVLGRSTIKDVIVQNAHTAIVITFIVSGNFLLEQYQAEKLKKHVSKICSKEILIKFRDVKENAT